MNSCLVKWGGELSYLALSLSSSEISLLEVFYVSGMNCPVMSLTVGTSTGLELKIQKIFNTDKFLA